MRCALQFDPEHDFAFQKVNAWSTMQSMKDEPSYREDDINNKIDKAYFDGYKSACDDVIRDVVAWAENDATGRLTDENGDILPGVVEDIKDIISSSICEVLFSILDEQIEDSERFQGN